MKIIIGLNTEFLCKDKVQKYLCNNVCHSSFAMRMRCFNVLYILHIYKHKRMHETFMQGLLNSVMLSFMYSALGNCIAKCRQCVDVCIQQCLCVFIINSFISCIYIQL